MTQSITAQDIYSSYDVVYGLMLKKSKNPQVAHDSAMDGILKAINNMDKYNGSSRVSTWVCTVAYRLWLDSVRSHANSKTTYTGDSVFMENVGGSYEQDFNVDNAGSIWAIAKELLNDKQYNCIKLFCDGLKYKEIAQRLNIPIGSVMSAISGAKKTLRENARFNSLFGE